MCIVVKSNGKLGLCRTLSRVKHFVLYLKLSIESNVDIAIIEIARHTGKLYKMYVYL